MENHSDSPTDKFQVYSECLKSIFEKIKKNIAKKHSFYNELTTVCKNIEESISQDKGKPLNADKYFLYMKWALEGDNVKMIEGILEAMQKLIKEDLLLGQSEDLQSRKEKIFAPGQLRRKLIDSMVDIVVNLFNLSDENIWLHCVKLFYTMYRNPNTRIHNESLLKILKICIRIFLSSRTNINCDTAKSSLNQMITQLFTKMEASNALIISRESLIQDEKESLGYLSNFSSISGRLSIKPSVNESFSRLTTNGNPLGSNLNNVNTSIGSLNTVSIVYRNPLDEMCGKVLKNIVDDVCIFFSKEEMRKSLSKRENSEQIPPLRSVPYCSPNDYEITEDNSERKKINSDSLKIFASPPAAYYKVCNPLIENEKGQISGNFGWCLVCRNSAHFYCKETRYPLCSIECKLKLQNEDQKISKHLSGELTSEDDVALMLFMDSVSIFKSLCKLVSTSVDRKSVV